LLKRQKEFLKKKRLSYICNKFILTNLRMTFLKHLFSAILIVTSLSSFANATELNPTSASDSLTLFPEQVPIHDSIINYGKLFLNTPYRYGASGSSSFDCSGFTAYIYKNFGYQLQRSSADQAEQFPRIEKQDLKTGDLVFFEGRRHNGRVGHVGIVVASRENGEFDFIHASTNHGVIISNSEEPYYLKRYVKGGRVVGSDTTGRIAAANPFIKQQEPVVAPPTEKVKRIKPAVYHKVKSGETLSGISVKSGLSVNELKRLNNMKSTVLHPNQQIKIKEQEIYYEYVAIKESNQSIKNNSDTIKEVTSKGLTHIVKKGETLTSIAKQHNVTVNELRADNDLTDGKILIGQKLNIGKQQEPQTNSATDKKELAENNVQISEQKAPDMQKIKTQENDNKTTQKHKVTSGESLFSIAQKYGVTIDELKSWNQLTESKITIGQTLAIQTTDKNIANQNSKQAESSKGRTYSIHVAKSGESLYSLAEKYNTTIDDIKEANDITTNSLQIGQKLKIPEGSKSKQNSEQFTHTITSGESLYSLAKKYNCSMDELREWNHLSKDQLNIGDKIKIRR